MFLHIYVCARCVLTLVLRAVLDVLLYDSYKHSDRSVLTLSWKFLLFYYLCTEITPIWCAPSAGRFSRCSSDACSLLMAVVSRKSATSRPPSEPLYPGILSFSFYGCL